MTKCIKLMAEYSAYPLWSMMSGDDYNLDPSTLPISSALITDLLNWSATYNSILNLDDPPNSEFPTQQDAVNFEREGNRLWRKLQDELSPEYQVWYFSEQKQELLIE